MQQHLVSTADGFIFAAVGDQAGQTPDTTHNSISYGTVANGTATSIAVGQGNTITSANGSSSAYGNQNSINGNQANAFGDGNTVTGAFAQAFGDSNVINGTNAIGYGYNNTVDGTTKTTAIVLLIMNLMQLHFKLVLGTVIL